MEDFSKYMLAQAERRAADNLYNYSSLKLELAFIGERLAEIKSQVEPLKSLIEKKLSERDRLYSAAFYVVTGNMPKIGDE